VTVSLVCFQCRGRPAVDTISEDGDDVPHARRRRRAGVEEVAVEDDKVAGGTVERLARQGDLVGVMSAAGRECVARPP